MKLESDEIANVHILKLITVGQLIKFVAIEPDIKVHLLNDTSSELANRLMKKKNYSF